MVTNISLTCRCPTEIDEPSVKITADKKQGIKAGMIHWTNQPPPNQHRRGPQNVLRQGKFFMHVQSVAAFIFLRIMYGMYVS
jgi:hypothetical protein